MDQDKDKQDKDNTNQIVNQGAYGCILKPGIKCNGTTLSEEYISKIQKKMPRTENEPIIGKILSNNVTNFEYFFAPAVDVCSAVLTEIKKTEIEKCNVYNNKKEKDEFVSIKIKYVGENTLGEHLIKHYKTSPNTFLNQIRNNYTHLENAVKLLVEQKIVHNDLKLNNVMYSDEKLIPIIIDFGMAYQYKDLEDITKLKTIFFTHYERYSPWGIEKLYIGSILENQDWENKMVSIDSLKQITNVFINENPIMISLKNFDEKIVKSYREKCLQNLKTFRNKQGKTVVNILKSSWDKWDMYSVNVMFFQMMMVCSSEKQELKNNTEWNEFMKTLANKIVFREPIVS